MSVTLEVLQNGASVGTFDEDQLGCDAGKPAICNATGLTAGDLSFSPSLFLNPDPYLGAGAAVANLNSSTQQFTMIFTLPIVAIPGSTLSQGNVDGGPTDLTGDGATLAAATGSALYTALIDGSPLTTLLPDPSSVTSPANDSANLPHGGFSSLAGPAALSNIGIRLDFTLTGGDIADLSSNLLVAVPEPGSLALAGLGLVALARAAARRPQA